MEILGYTEGTVYPHGIGPRTGATPVWATFPNIAQAAAVRNCQSSSFLGNELMRMSAIKPNIGPDGSPSGATMRSHAIYFRTTAPISDDFEVD